MRLRPNVSRLALVGVAALAALAMPPAAAACSCVGPEEQLRMAGQDPRTVVLTGTPGVETPLGVPVAVNRWYVGGGMAPVVNLQVESGMESSCGTTAPPPGREHLFVLWRDDAGQLLFHLCSVAADLSTEDGRARFAQAEALFGRGLGPDPSPLSTSPPDVPTVAGTIIGMLAPLVIVVAFGAGLLLGLVGVLKRTRFGRD